jgi:aspartate racemase
LVPPVTATRFWHKRFRPTAERSICMAHADLSAVFRYVTANEPLELAHYLVGIIERLRGAGATLIAIPAVTPHFCIARLKELFPLPIVDLLDVIVRQIQVRQFRKVAIFGTKYVMESNLFGVLDNVVEVAVPSTRVLDRIISCTLD